MRDQPPPNDPAVEYAVRLCQRGLQVRVTPDGHMLAYDEKAEERRKRRQEINRQHYQKRKQQRANPLAGLCWEDMPGTSEMVKKLNWNLLKRGRYEPCVGLAGDQIVRKLNELRHRQSVKGAKRGRKSGQTAVKPEGDRMEEEAA